MLMMKVYVLVFVENPANFTLAEHLILTLDNEFINLYGCCRRRHPP